VVEEQVAHLAQLGAPLEHLLRVRVRVRVS